MCGCRVTDKRSAESKLGVFCRDPWPGGKDLFCVKEPGHDGPHTTLLGVHPQYEDGWGGMVPEQEEWDEWPT